MLTKKNANFIANELSARLETWEELSHYETPWLERLRQHIQQYAYWNFRRNTGIARTILPLIPVVSRARNWSAAPEFTCSRDHVLIVFRKSSSDD